ncbi:hypothetical protein [Roseospirillum parvum]|uniref:Uncharacterized protein n=1 Tax=Roseospirillum parvum TaxID=83401 RepID=A0A1G8D1D2_9PROT|nr:hypothetical protein [Roseospirillum parvum]SDH51303.1 hypothetical protein SAMN05421742_107149 [Roseospirillum parvum]
MTTPKRTFGQAREARREVVSAYAAHGAATERHERQRRTFKLAVFSLIALLILGIGGPLVLKAIDHGGLTMARLLGEPTADNPYATMSAEELGEIATAAGPGVGGEAQPDTGFAFTDRLMRVNKALYGEEEAPAPAE